jgi:hypothetical protein
MRVGVLATLIAFAAASSLAWAAELVDGEAFGIRMGAPTADLDSLVMSASADPSIRSYMLKSVPKPHPLLQTYFAQSSDRVGVCSVGGTTSSKELNRAGEIEQELLRGLTGQFGVPVTKTYRVDDRLVGFWKRALGHSDLGEYLHSYNPYTWTRGGLSETIVLHRRVPVPYTLSKPGYLEHSVSLDTKFKNYADCVREGEELHRRK